MSDPSFEALVIARLDDLKEDNRIILKKFDEHAKEDVVRFEAIDKQFASAASIAAEAKGAATATAKVWGLCAGLPAPLVGAIYAVWKMIHEK